MSKTLPRLAATVALVAALALSSCGTSDGAAVDGLGCKPSSQPQSKTAPTVPKVTAPKKVETKDLKKGTGCGIEVMQYHSLSLIGADVATGKVFLNSWTDGHPTSTTDGELLKGLETGIKGMKVGGVRQIVLPAAEAYGEAGDEALGIGPNEPLVWIVELDAVTMDRQCVARRPDPGDAKVPVKAKDLALPEHFSEYLQTEDLKVGSGPAIVAGSKVAVHYIGIECRQGKTFDQSFARGEPLQVTVGENTVPGFSQGLLGAKKDGIRRIEIPPSLGYGAEGNPPDIAGNDPLLFVVQIVSVAPPAPTTTTAPPTTVAGPATTAAPGATTSAPPTTTP